MTFIPCQVSKKHQHRTVKTTVDLAQPHGFPDYPPVPPSMGIGFTMHTWDQTVAPPADLGWCPARDTVSETIQNQGIWEPVETITMLSLFQALPEGSVFVDMGAQLGWYSRLAEACGVTPLMYEADDYVADVLRRNVVTGDIIKGVIGHTTTVPKINVPHVAKIDVEGAELEAVFGLFVFNRPQAVLIELSPCFDVDMDGIVAQFAGRGYCPAWLPDKQVPPAEYTGVHDLKFQTSWGATVERANGLGQINILAASTEWLENQEW